MNTTPTAYAEFGYTLSLVERTLTAILRTHLAERNIEAETWYALRLIRMKGPQVERKALVDELATSPRLSGESARKLLVDLEAKDLIRGDATLELTQHGESLYGELAEHVGAARDRLLSHFEIGDIETTVRTMKAIAERAAAGY